MATIETEVKPERVDERSSETHSHHHPRLVHHFESMEQQREAGTLGMWWFLLTEIMFFGGMFLAYTVYRHMYFTAYAAGSNVLNIWWGTFNTVVLIGSSLTMALAVFHAQMGNARKIVLFLLATILLGSIFLRVKYIEYNDKFVEHVFPAGDFRWPVANESTRPDNLGDLLLMLVGAEHLNGAASSQVGVTENMDERSSIATKNAEKGPPAEAKARTPEGVTDPYFGGHVRMFFWLYFAMTGFHALHMVIGIGIMLVLAWQAWHAKFSREYHSYIELFGLYWHFVDIVWIFLFALLYLVDRHP